MGTGVSPLVGLSRVTCSRVSAHEAGDTSSLPYGRPGHSGRIATMEAGDLFTLLIRAAATDQAISQSLRQCELAVQDLIAIGSAEEKPGQNDRPLVDPADKGDGPESVQHRLRDADMDLAALGYRLEAGENFPRPMNSKLT